MRGAEEAGDENIKDIVKILHPSHPPSSPNHPQVLGTVKNAIVVLLGIVLFNEHVSGTQLVGYIISALAFFWDQQIKMQQVHGKPAPPPESPPPKGSPAI